MPEPVSLILTVLNEADTVPTLMTSVCTQTRPPDEVIVVDGGSTDHTLSALRAFEAHLPLRVFVEPGANISRGRNRAISEAHHDLIAVTDAGVRLDPRWLEHLTAPFAAPDPPDFVSGFFLPDPHTLFEVALAATTLPAQEEMGRGRFMPSSRSVAFRRHVWEAVGGYPEWADFSEDVLFDLAVQARGFRIAYAPDAIVYFRPRPSLRAFARQYRQYALGDGQGLLWPTRHAIRYATYVGLVPALATLARRHPKMAGTLWALGATAMFYTPYKRLWRMRSSLRRREWPLAALLVPLIRVTGDVAKMWGYPQGLPQGWRHRERVRAYVRGETTRRRNGCALGAE
ncbi:MAG: glycosyltransferase [Ardenticatenia bacterium]|nr:glycosyltransferase [Ardenticatenia bacterium]